MTKRPQWILPLNLYYVLIYSCLILTTFEVLNFYHFNEIKVDLADVLVVAVLQGVPARAQLPDGHQEGHDHALGHPLHRVHHAILVVVVTKYFSRVLVNDFL